MKLLEVLSFIPTEQEFKILDDGDVVFEGFRSDIFGHFLLTKELHSIFVNDDEFLLIQIK